MQKKHGDSILVEACRKIKLKARIAEHCYFSFQLPFGQIKKNMVSWALFLAQLLGYTFFSPGSAWVGSENASTLSAPQSRPFIIQRPPRPGPRLNSSATLIPPSRPDQRPRIAAPRVASMARVYADVNQNMPRAYWDYDSVNISEPLLPLSPPRHPPPVPPQKQILTWRPSSQAGESSKTTRSSARSVRPSHSSSASDAPPTDHSPTRPRKILRSL